jgi:glycosyltransferase involved in cell wall biosynthesis
MSVAKYSKPIQVFVHLAKGFDARRWEKRWAAGQIVGINERLPYGYFRAADDGCVVCYSGDETKNKLIHLLGSWIMSIVGVDILHAWRNKNGIYASDVVWTHTEIEYLAVLLLFLILFWRRRPKLIAQNVWLFDRWHSLSTGTRWILSRLIVKADILTFLSPENLKVARNLFPEVRCGFVPFGINTDDFPALKRKKPHHPVHVLLVGNDPHRDWQILIEAMRSLPDCCLKIASKKVEAAQIASCSNIEVLNISSNDQLFAAFGWADILAVTLKPNLHASGITVLQEAAMRGVAIVCTDTGGLRAYFSDDEIYYIPGNNSFEIQTAIMTLAANDELRRGLSARAQERMKSGGLSSRSYARRHAELSRELLARESRCLAAAPARETGGLICGKLLFER